MSYPPQQPPAIPGYTPRPPQGDWSLPRPPRPPRSRVVPWLVGVLGVLTLGVIGLAVVLANHGGKPTASASTAAALLPQDPCGGGICNTTPANYKPKTSDFKLTAKITDKQCFGSAGCNVSFRVDVEYAGTTPLDPGATWLVVYEIDGVEDAPQVGNFHLTGTQINGTEEAVQTASTKNKITLKVTSIEEG